MLRASLLALALPAVLVAAPVLAQPTRLVPEPAVLDYTRAQTCPEEQFFRDLVASHLGGRDPFVPTAPRRVSLTLRRVGRAFGATLVLYDDAGKRLGSSPELLEPDCTRAIETASTVVAPWLLPLVVRRRAAPPEAQPPPDAPSPPALEPQSTPATPAHVTEPSVAAAPASVVPPKPGVFEGRAGLGRALLYAFAAASVATGTGFAVAASHKDDEARQAQGALEQKKTPACLKTSSAFAGECQRLVELRQAHDNDARAALGFFAAAGVTGAVATASIWILRTPAASAVQVTPTAPGGLAGLTVRGSW
jgi:hypothetical protein